MALSLFEIAVFGVAVVAFLGAIDVHVPFTAFLIAFNVDRPQKRVATAENGPSGVANADERSDERQRAESRERHTWYAVYIDYLARTMHSALTLRCLAAKSTKSGGSAPPPNSEQ